MDFRPDSDSDFDSAADRPRVPVRSDEPAAATGLAWLYRSEAFAEDVLELVASLPQCSAGAPERRAGGVRDVFAGGTRAWVPRRVQGGPGAGDGAFAGAVRAGLGSLGWQGA